MHRKWPSQDALGFGFGEHRCIAEGLAKAELTTVFCKISPPKMNHQESTAWRGADHVITISDSVPAASQSQDFSANP